MFFSSRHFCGNRVQRETRLVSHKGFERRSMCSAVLTVIVSEFCERKHIQPSLGGVHGHASEVLFDFLINSFSFSVGLGMISGRHSSFDTKCFPNVFRYLRSELWSSVRNDLVG